MEIMLLLAEKFNRLCNGLEYVNLGSGMGIPYSLNEVPLNMKLLSKDISHRFNAAHPNTNLIMETGWYAVDKSGIYVTKVVARKALREKNRSDLKN